MTTEQEPRPRIWFVPSILPFLVAAGALALYLVTLNHWISLGSLLPVAKVSGWIWQPELSEPLYWLVTLPFRWLPAKAVPLALNVLAVVCASLTLALLARSVALLPHDRTHEQRQREHGAFSLLSVPAAWLPPVLAVLVCGLQLTFWEHATVASGEMLNLLLFAYVLRCLLEFRIEQRDSWLTQAAFVYGLGITNNWAMIGFFPLFIISLIWVRGLSFFNLRFLARMFLWGLLGLLVYLLPPIIQSRAEFSPVPFFQGLRINPGTQIGTLTAIYKNLRQPIALLSLTSLLPIFIISIKWASYFGDTSKIGVGLATFMFHFVHALFLLACIWVALDPPVSPRHVIPAIPFLTFYYLAALSIGYISGYFLLVFRSKPERSRKNPGYLSFINSASNIAIWLLLILTPALLIYRNLRPIRITNGPMFQQMGALTMQELPASGAVALTDDTLRLLLAQAAAAQTGQDKSVIFADAGSVSGRFALEFPDYHRYLRKRYPDRWPADVPKTQKGTINPLAVVPLIGALGRSNTVFYLHPSFGFYFEYFHLEPHGFVYKVLPYSAGLLPPLPTKEIIAENESFWSKADDEAVGSLLRDLTPPPRPSKPGLMDWFKAKAHLLPETNQNATVLASFYSRSLNYWGVELQKAGVLDRAAAHFQRALELNPDNVAAEVNLECNEKLRAGKPTPVQTGKSIVDRFGPKHRNWNTVVGANGPFDDPTFCYEQAQAFIQNSLFRQALQQFTRVKELDPTHLSARLWLVQLYIRSQQPEKALQMVEEIHQKESFFGVGRSNINEFVFADASAHLALKDGAAADAAVSNALQRFPEDNQLRSAILDTATHMYMNFRFFSNAVLTADEQLKLTPDNPAALFNKGSAHLQLGAFEQAIPPLTRVLELQSTNLPARLNRAIAYLKSDQLDPAQKDYEILQKAAPNAFFVDYGIAEIAYRKNDTNSAIRWYELYLTHHPVNPEEIESVKKRLAELKAPQQ